MGGCLRLGGELLWVGQLDDLRQAVALEIRSD